MSPRDASSGASLLDDLICEEVAMLSVSTGTLSSDGAAEFRYALPAHVYLCAFAVGSVVLDLKRNRYFGLDVDASDQLSALIDCANSPVSNPDDLAARWIARGLLERTQRTSQPFAPGLHVALSSLEDLQPVHPHLRPRDIAHFTWECAYARHSLRNSSLWQIACDLHARRAHKKIATDAPLSALASAVERFRRLRPLAFAAHDQCLFHALALTRFLTAFGLPATWVIGVRLYPWGAHSWVQHGSLVFDATPESVHDFRPIIAV
ncbi:lasso peptide biosynthesis B2 protein [Povalibacter sp.]|uniref:lasso peptide biosynthesis B2 protein n=1 Tax=Povalibacter sp. TaxID=1962978 RepID=UPI002F41CC97